MLAGGACPGKRRNGDGNRSRSCCCEGEAAREPAPAADGGCEERVESLRRLVVPRGRDLGATEDADREDEEEEVDTERACGLGDRGPELLELLPYVRRDVRRREAGREKADHERVYGGTRKPAGEAPEPSSQRESSRRAEEVEPWSRAVPSLEQAGADISSERDQPCGHEQRCTRHDRQYENRRTRARERTQLLGPAERSRPPHPAEPGRHVGDQAEEERKREHGAGQLEREPSGRCDLCCQRANTHEDRN